MSFYKTLYLFAIAFLFAHISFAQNPVIKDIGMSDPHVRVFGDTLYLYTGHDTDPKDKTWVMKDWHVFSSTDLVNWTLRDTISPKDNYMNDESTDCWASDAASRNGNYYFYFSDRKRGVGVMHSKSPTGPFVDALGKPLVSPMHDPTILIDDDAQNTPYLIYGDKAGGGFHIAKLKDDMISLAEQPTPIKIEGKEWEIAPNWMDKNYIFKHEDTYYLSWGRDYAISKNIYGPYQCVGAVGRGHHLDEFAHGSFFEWKGQFYHIWCYYLREGFKYRESIITYCHFDDEGKIVTDTQFLDKHFDTGVARYDASWDNIEAEWFYSISGDIHKEGNKEEGFFLTNIQADDWISFSNINFENTYKKITFKIASNSNKGLIEVRKGNANGELLGKVRLPKRGNKDGFKEVSFELLKEIQGNHDIYIVCKGQKKLNVKLDKFCFNEE